MTINLRATDIELTPAIHQYVEEKFSSLDKYQHAIVQLDVILKKDAQHHKGKIFMCSVNVDLPGELLKIERGSDDLYKSIDEVKDHLRETLAQHKQRTLDSSRKEDDVTNIPEEV